MTSTKRVHFHVGAHKTATTYIQARLRANQELLRAAGIDFVDLWAKRKEEAAYRATLKLALEGDAIDEHKAAEASKQLREIADKRVSDERDLVVMSFENVLGDYDLSRGGGIYPNAEAAMLHLLRAFPDHDVRIFFSLRSLDRFLESGYVQRVYSRFETRSFKRYLADVDAESMSWIPVIRAMDSTVGRSNVTVWAYEDFLKNESRVWDALLGRGDAEKVLYKPTARTNPSLSDKGLRYMRGINKMASARDARTFRKFVKSHFGLQAGLKPPKLLNTRQREPLVSMYGRNLSEIRAACQMLI